MQSQYLHEWILLKFKILFSDNNDKGNIRKCLVSNTSPQLLPAMRASLYQNEVEFHQKVIGAIVNFSTPTRSSEIDEQFFLGSRLLSKSLTKRIRAVFE